MSSVQEEKPPAEAPKTRMHELRNAELVSRFLAATPPYLYSALPLQPHAFFFSEMLRSFVNARHGCRPPHYHRRFKRRSHKYFAENEHEPAWPRRADWPKVDEEKKEPDVSRPEVPLELTVEKHAKVRETSPRDCSPKPEHTKSHDSPGPPGRASSFVDVGTEEIPKPVAPCPGRNPQEAVPHNLILPPPPPMWYPPIYNPQFGVDPLNFFIDLRVSGHIYDRKRLGEGLETSTGTKMDESNNIDKRIGRDISRPRHLSAFSVPVKSSHLADQNKYYDEKSIPNCGTSYIMKNLKSVYDNLHSNQEISVKEKEGSDSKDGSDMNEDDIVD